MVKASPFHVVALSVLIVAPSGASQTPVSHADAVAFARRVAAQVLNFRQGDANALPNVNAQFTADGWAQFLATFSGFRDSAGAPTFNSSFEATADGRVVDELSQAVHVRIPGTLVQAQKQSKTTYQIAVDVWVNENPLIVRRLTQTTCRGGSKACE